MLHDDEHSFTVLAGLNPRINDDTLTVCTLHKKKKDKHEMFAVVVWAEKRKARFVKIYAIMGSPIRSLIYNMQ